MGWFADKVWLDEGYSTDGEREKYTQNMYPLPTASQGSTVYTFKEFNSIPVIL